MSGIPAPNFPGVALPTSDFGAVRSGQRAALLQYDVALGSARSFAAGSQLNLDIAGNFLYVDQKANSGNCTVHFQDQNGNAVSVTLLPGQLWRVPFTKLGIENDAQAGSTMRLIYGTDVDALPISAAGVTVLNTPAVTETGHSYGAAFASSTFLVAATPENVIAAASNVAGYTVHAASIRNARSVGNLNASMLAKATAPATFIDGDVLLVPSNGLDITAAMYHSAGELRRAVRVEAGKRLDFISSATEDNAPSMRRVLYNIN